jgi:photosystem II stability/assembly factor-like uncharacterized protein
MQMPKFNNAIRDGFADQVDRHSLPPTLESSNLKSSIRSRASMQRDKSVWPGVIATVIAAALIAALVSIRISAHLPTSNDGGTAPPKPTIAPAPANTSGLQAIRPLSASELWGVTDRAVLKSSDGGNSWHVTREFAGRISQFDSLSDGTSAWVLAVSGGQLQLFETADGGKSWHAANAPPANSAESVEMTFIDPSHGWILFSTGAAAGSEGVELWSTSDGGQAWTLDSKGSGAATGSIPFSCEKTGVSFDSPNNGWLSGRCSGGTPFLYTTQDGGKTWSEQALPAPAGWPSARLEGDIAVGRPSFTADGAAILPVGPVAARSGQLQTLFYESTDHGRNWRPMSMVPFAPSAVDIVSVGFWIIAGNGIVEATNDSGQTWVQLGSGQDIGLVTEIAFSGTQDGWLLRATSTGASLLKTIDGGKTWITVAS